MTRIVHCKREMYNVYIGRAEGEKGKWGNLYSHKLGTSAKFRVNSIKEAIEAYDEWIRNGDGKHLLNDLGELEGKVLGCWCGNFTLEDMDNLKCHGQILLNLLADKHIAEALINTK